MTQRTEVTVSPRDSVKDAEQVARVVHITAAGTIPVQVQDSPTKLFAACLRFLYTADKLGVVLPLRFSISQFETSTCPRRSLVTFWRRRQSFRRVLGRSAQGDNQIYGSYRRNGSTRWKRHPCHSKQVLQRKYLHPVYTSIHHFEESKKSGGNRLRMSSQACRGASEEWKLQAKRLF